MKKLNNESGAILILTLLFILGFTSLGIASIYFAGQQDEFTDKLKFSTQALWRADGAIERSRNLLPSQEINDPTNVGDPLPNYGNDDSGNPMTYKINTTRMGHFLWQADSIATVNGQIRAITAQIDSSGIFRFGDLNANGDVDRFDNGDQCTSIGSSGNAVNCSKVEENMALDFEEIFPHVPPINFSNSDVDQKFDDDNTTAELNYSNLTDPAGLVYVKITQNSSNNVNPPAFDNSGSSPGFVIFDFTDKPGNRPNLSLQVADFEGIIWVKGDADVHITGQGGSGTWTGAFFMEGEGTVTLGGNMRINYSDSNNPPTPVSTTALADALVGALSELQGETPPPSDQCTVSNPTNCVCPPDCPSEPTIASWKEIDCSASPFGCS